MTAHLVRGDARNIPLKDKSVQVIVTSPPYMGLRSYGGQVSIWGGDSKCPHTLADDPAVKPMTGGTGPTSGKQTSNKGSQFGNAWTEESRPIAGGGYSDKSTLAGFTNDQTKGRLMSNGNAPVTTATCTRCGAWRGELGSEPNVALFISHLVEVFREVKRVLRDDGVCFLNMGDSYAGSGKGPSGKSGIGDQVQRQGFTGGIPHHAPYAGRVPPVGARQKSLLLVPERLAIALSDDGWIVRSRIAWCKAAPMPESVRDRPTSAWEHIWMLTKQAKYYWDADAVREKAVNVTQPRNASNGLGNGALAPDRHFGTPDQQRNLWNYWLLSPDSYPGQHFATFPREIPRRCILAATSEYGACAACGAAWRRTTERIGLGALKVRHVEGETPKHDARVEMGLRSNKSGLGGSNSHNGSTPQSPVTTTTGWIATCRCGPAAGVRPCIVADIFSGSGTTAYVAAFLGRVGVGVELSAEYTRQARYGRLAQGFLPLAAPPPEAPRLPLEVEG